MFKAQRHSSIILNQTIVIISFLTFIVIITFTRRSLINLVTYLMILCLQLIYLSFGLKRLLKVWNIVTSYTALVLVAQLGY
jgi:energy-coupling factor transporter transmembrane protein EcfT